MSQWMARKTLRGSRSNELDTRDEPVRRPKRSQSARCLVAVSRGLLAMCRRHNSMIKIRSVGGCEREKTRYQSRSYLNSPVKRAQYFRDYADNALQGRLNRPEGAARH